MFQCKRVLYTSICLQIHIFLYTIYTASVHIFLPCTNNSIPKVYQHIIFYSMRQRATDRPTVLSFVYWNKKLEMVRYASSYTVYLHFDCFLCLSICLFVFLFVCMSFFLSACLWFSFVYLSVCQFACLSVFPSFSRYVFLSVNMSVCYMPTYLSVSLFCLLPAWLKWQKSEGGSTAFHITGKMPVINGFQKWK